MNHLEDATPLVLGFEGWLLLVCAMQLKGALALRELKFKELREQNEAFKKVQEEELWANSSNLAYVCILTLVMQCTRCR